ncbi:MAG: pyridoxamine 5'-phosphate oxidase family protein [Candidatus Taylorbacteria bacterium]|nr:pyridoxamine 5'-phosphate oxidase family protein [Candidatus Taylorbacteria bacterium]
MINLLEIKELIENNPVAFATVTENNKPNVIGVAFVKVVFDNEVLITDNYMNQTKMDILQNENVCLVVWNRDLKGYKIIGKAEYFTEGKWKKFVEEMKENSGLPAKGAILIKVEKIIASA